MKILGWVSIVFGVFQIANGLLLGIIILHSGMDGWNGVWIGFIEYIFCGLVAVGGTLLLTLGIKVVRKNNN